MADDTADRILGLYEDPQPSYSTPDVLRRLPVRDPLSDPRQYLIEHLARQGKAAPAAWGTPHKDVLSDILPGAQSVAAKALGALPSEAWMAAAFLGPGPKTSPRSLKALEKAKEITADTSGKPLTPGERTEKAWKAGGQYGGWDQLPVRMGADGKPDMEWLRFVSTFDPKKPAIAAFDTPSAPYDRNWLGRYPKEKAKGTLGELVNLNPKVLEEFPDLAGIPTKIVRSHRDLGNTRGAYGPPGWIRGEKMRLYGDNNADIAETAAHEINHAMAQRRGWSSGSSPELEKRPWIGWGYDYPFRGSSDNAINRYGQVVGEQMANLDAKLNTNKPYREGELSRYGSNFPSIEYLNMDGSRGKNYKKYIAERDPKGKQPQDMPPSWQLEAKPEDMRNTSGSGWALARALQKGAMVYGGFDLAGRGLGYMADEGKKSAADKKLIPMEYVPPPKPQPSVIGDYFGGRAKAEDKEASSDRFWRNVHGGGAGIGTVGALIPPRNWWLMGASALPAYSAISLHGSAEEHDRRAEDFRRAQRMWAETGLPDRPLPPDEQP